MARGRIGLAASLMALVAASGCFPVSSIVGRPACVLPRGGDMLQYAAGFQYGKGRSRTERVEDEPETAVSTTPYGAIVATGGLGRRWDFQGGFHGAFIDVLGFYGIARYQFLGEPWGEYPRRGPRLDASVDIGGSVGAAGGSWLGGFAGLNLSVPGRSVSPYASWRYRF